MPSNLVQKVKLPAPATAVYSALMNSKKHAAFTSSSARIGTKVGAKIAAYDNYITGYNLDLVPNQRIVQAWRASDWPQGAFSIATFLLEDRKDHTMLVFQQTGVPDEVKKEISQGWKDFYWKPLVDWLKKDR